MFRIIMDKKYIGYMGRLCYIQDTSAVVSDMLMLKKKDFEKAGCFDESFDKAFSDISLCLNLRRLGLLNVFDPYAEGVSDKAQILLGCDDEAYLKDLEIFKDKYAKELEEGDPYYNANLTKESLDYSVC